MLFGGITMIIWKNVAHRVCISSKCWHILFCNIKKKSHLSISPPRSLYWQAAKFTFPQIPNLCLKTCYYWPQTLSVVFLEMTGSLCSFSRNFLPDAQVWITIVCQLFFHIKIMFSEENGASWVCNSNNCTSAFSLDKNVLRWIRHALGFHAVCVLFIALHRILKSHAKKKTCASIKIYQINNCFIKDILKWNCFFTFSF